MDQAKGWVELEGSIGLFKTEQNYKHENIHLMRNYYKLATTSPNIIPALETVHGFRYCNKGHLIVIPTCIEYKGNYTTRSVIKKKGNTAGTSAILLYTL